MVLDSGWSPVGLKKPLGRHLGGLEQFGLGGGASVLGQWASSLVVLSMVLGGGL